MLLLINFRTFLFLLLSLISGTVQGQSVGMKFDPLQNGVQVGAPVVQWKLTDQSILMGDVLIDDSSFLIQVGALADLDPLLAKAVGNPFTLVVDWPRGLIKKGLLEAHDRAGNLRWTFPLGDSEITDWGEVRSRWRSSLRKSPDPRARALADATSRSVLWTAFAKPDFSPEEIPLEAGTQVRFCLSDRSPGAEYGRICTGYLEFRENEKKQLQFFRVRSMSTTPQVIVSKQVQKLEGEFALPEKAPLQFFAQLGSGISVDFLLTTPKFRWVDVVESNSGRTRRFSIQGAVPTRYQRQIESFEKNILERWIGPWWERSISFEEPTYQVDLPSDMNQLSILAEHGGVITLPLTIGTVPTERIRPRLNRGTPTGTYISQPPLEGKKAKNTELKDPSVRMKKNGEDFVWNFSAPKRGEIHRSYINVQKGEDQFRAYYDMYRGTPREISLRFSALTGTDGASVLLGEAAFQYWFEDFLGMTNYWLGRHRWGLSAKSFRSLSNLNLGLIRAPIQHTSLLLKYRFTPGLWVRDESFGLILGVVDLNWPPYVTRMSGAGLFWARSMPRALDTALNWIPIFRYPKWVDMDFLYLSTQLTARDIVIQQFGTSSGGLGGNWEFNFRGKVLVSESFFYEAGMGIKRFDMLRNDVVEDVQTRLSFLSGFATFGMGFNF